MTAELFLKRIFSICAHSNARTHAKNEQTFRLFVLTIQIHASNIDANKNFSLFCTKRARARKRNHCRLSGMHGAICRHRPLTKKGATRPKKRGIDSLKPNTDFDCVSHGVYDYREDAVYSAYIVAFIRSPPQRNFQLEMLDATFRMTNHQIKLCGCACVRRWPCENLFTSIPFRLHYYIRGFINIK